jgi:homoserine dehydrogenase
MAGFGKIGMNVAGIFTQNSSRSKRYNAEFRIVCAVDISRAAIASVGLNLQTLVNARE